MMIGRLYAGGQALRRGRSCRGTLRQDRWQGTYIFQQSLTSRFLLYFSSFFPSEVCCVCCVVCCAVHSVPQGQHDDAVTVGCIGTAWFCMVSGLYAALLILSSFLSCLPFSSNPLAHFFGKKVLELILLIHPRCLEHPCCSWTSLKAEASTLSFSKHLYTSRKEKIM